MPNENGTNEQKRLEELQQRAGEINSRIIPEHPGYVREDGPRRQYRSEVRNGMLHLIEI